MNSFSVGGRVVGTLMVAGMLVGCSGGPVNQLGTVPSGTSPQKRSFNKMRSSTGDLIYATGGCGGTCVLSYPDGKIVGSISTYGGGPCSDAAGNVSIPSGYQVLEFQHGGAVRPTADNLPAALWNAPERIQRP